MPDDYRRFAIHGRKLLEHLDRLEPKGPEYLPLVRKEVEDRLGRTQEAIDRLSSQTAGSRIVAGYGQVVPASVFDRASSLSETDSTTPLSQRSLGSTDNWVSIVDGEGVHMQSPSTYSPHDFNPYHFHVPYPHKGTIPAPPFQDDSHSSVDDTTEVPTPRRTSLRDSNLTASPPMTSTLSAWREDGPSHRTVKKNEMRRYHDRGGAWRNQGVGDPRISVSREVAKGSISRARAGSNSPNRVKLTAESEAELTLNGIKKVSPPSPRGGGHAQDHDATSSCTPARPRFILGRNSYANVAAGKIPETEYSMSPTEFTSGLAKSSSPPSSWTAATLKRLKENILPSRTKSADQAGKAQDITAAPPGSRSPHDDEGLAASGLLITTPPAPMFQGTRTANSSPGQPSGPYAPPGPGEADTLRRDLPASVRQWETQIYHPGRGHIDSSDLMALSYPNINVHPPPAWPRGLGLVDGYTSEPMTRDPSAQSSTSHGAAPGATVGSRHSSPRGTLPHSPTYVRPATIPYPRSPSVIETEPSPHVADAFPDVDTSYQRWEARFGPGRRRAGSGSRFSGSPVTPHRLPRGEGRSQSQGPNADRERRRQVPLSFHPPSASYDGSQPMARSGSGGIKLEDGRIIEFGQIAVDIERARHWADQQQHERDTRAVSPDESDDGGLGLGIMH